MLCEYLAYQNAHRLPLLASWPVTRRCLLVPIEASDMSRGLCTQVVEVLQRLVLLRNTISCHVDNVGRICRCLLCLVGSTPDFVEMLQSQLKIKKIISEKVAKNATWGN